MRHLESNRLNEIGLDDSVATSDELTHLETCSECGLEIARERELTSSLNDCTLLPLPHNFVSRAVSRFKAERIAYTGRVFAFASLVICSLSGAIIWLSILTFPLWSARIEQFGLLLRALFNVAVAIFVELPELHAFTLIIATALCAFCALSFNELKKTEQLHFDLKYGSRSTRMHN